ncbi:MAG TPA: DUF2752 domain-containing protein [Bacteroides sp.]|nr:DUF2752 domain-containing protein [Bacteroides sp.]
MAGKKPYLIINIILAGMIGLVLIYSGLFSADKDNHPVPSYFEKITGQPSPSSGMSRAFSEIIRGNFETARNYNDDSLLIFAFFLIQGMQRISVSILLVKSGIKKKHLLFADVFLTVVSFILCFLGQIRAMLQLLSG